MNLLGIESRGTVGLSAPPFCLSSHTLVGFKSLEGSRVALIATVPLSLSSLSLFASSSSFKTASWSCFDCNIFVSCRKICNFFTLKLMEFLSLLVEIVVCFSLLLWLFLFDVLVRLCPVLPFAFSPHLFS